MDKPRCFAYNMSAQRCDLEAGHPGDHGITMEWTDDECFVPGAAPVPTAGTTPVIYMPAPEPVEDEDPTGPCVACNHGFLSHGEGGCVGRQEDGDTCGCYTYV